MQIKKTKKRMKRKKKNKKSKKKKKKSNKKKKKRKKTQKATQRRRSTLKKEGKTKMIRAWNFVFIVNWIPKALILNSSKKIFLPTKKYDPSKLSTMIFCQNNYILNTRLTLSLCPETYHIHTFSMTC